MSDPLARRIAQGAGRAPADLVIRGARLLDLVTGDLAETDIAVCGDTVVGTYGRYEGGRVIEAGGRIAVPGFIDTHLHIESSLITPHEFDRCVLPRGVTTAIWDPHELANVLGTAAFDYALAAAGETVMDIRVQLSSCVPATDLESAGARIEAGDLAAYRDHPRALGLAEFMNVPGVLAGDPGCLAKLDAFAGRHVDGHAPLLSGLALNAYAAAGIRTDHEATSAAEALEKIRKGMTVLIREGSVSKDLHALAPLLTVGTSPFLAFCTDDRNPLDIAEEGHLDHLIRTAIGLGVPPLAAYRAASLSAAAAFGLTDRGLIAPGRRADIVLLDDLAACAVAGVIAGGRPVDDAVFAARPRIPAPGRDSVRAAPVTPDDFRVDAPGARETSVIGVVPGRIITEHRRLTLPARDGAAACDPARDVVKVAVVARHGTRSIGRGFVQGFGLRRGAIASSVGHDSHNLCVVGADDADMAFAVNRLIALQGGFVVAQGGAVLAELPLPIAGLVSDLPFEAVRDALLPLRAAARALGCTLPEPFLQVAFLPLPVIPHLKITDRGLVDVDRMVLL
ncbi:Adenine deaminase [Methylobacterium crusticola]|uniref:Adenine deaminase n=1 Tax=Methylobacterium crusticola TaxID=1697972 RepID=A0ABQ4QRB4_9HYPH|nr:adenine deaminase [Methylobacterium crusticola]GJD47850.1 Adenine deaminase [Methylobacterium crusticola]